MTTSGDYVLGTHDAEVARLGLQHGVWRDRMLSAWQLAGLGAGWRVVDVGAGPGFATWELAEAVGPKGEVLAVERSEHFAAAFKAEQERRQLKQVRLVEGDLMKLTPPTGYDMTWCRWVASFTESVPRLVAWIKASLRPGGTAVFHEYLEYTGWSFVPPRPHHEQFVGEVVKSWRAAGGEPNVAPALVGELRAAGFRIRSARPHVWITRPGEPSWQWPAAFVAVNVARLQELGQVTPAWGAAVLKEFAEAEADEQCLMVTPMVLEVIAERA